MDNKQILQKVLLTTEDVQQLTELNYQSAVRLIQQIKATCKTPFDWKGYVSTAAFCKYMGITEEQE